MPRYEYRPMDEAPKDGTPIIAVCGGVEMGIAWESDFVMNWVYFDEDEGPSFEAVRGPIKGWRPMFGRGD